MTRNRTCVNTSCVNFKNMCEPYVSVYTGGYSKTSIRGVDEPDVSDYIQSFVSEATISQESFVSQIFLVEKKEGDKYW